MRFDGATSGPVVGITICTHGNEPCGLAAANAVLNHFKTKERLQYGTLYLVLNNLEGALRHSRLIDINMNRLPSDVFHSKKRGYEIRRSKQLRPIWECFEYALDIHSTTQDNGPMLIAVGKELPIKLTRGFPMDKLVSNIDKIQIGKPAASFYGTSRKPARVFGIECGAHQASATFARAETSALALLKNLQMISGRTRTRRKTYKEYRVRESVMFPDASYELLKIPENFAFLPKGTVIAKGENQSIKMRRGGHTLMAYTKKPKNRREEVLFLTEPMKLRYIK